ncbi:MAG: type II secretion system inner membrane protein GspF [Alphaproteobacteria bacterium]|nr:type II secretion system inner membrane protein GspF [Alphaproteobacteria bacterium]
MPVYEYKAFDGAGAPTSGVIDADNEKAARSRLRRQGLFPSEVKEQTGKAVEGSGLRMEIDVAQYLEWISARDIANVTNQLSVLIGASVPMAESLAALVEQTEKNKLKVVLSNVRERVNEGSTLADALADHPKIFDNLFVSMVRAGERTGSLAEVLDRLSKFADSQVRLQGQIVSALAYPVLLTMVGVGILLAIFTGILPQMRSMFDSFGGEENLPIITKVVFAVGDFLVGWGWTVPPVILAAVWGFRRWLATPAGRERFDRWKLEMPVLGRVNRMVAVSRFSRTLSTLLMSGVPIITALGIVRAVVGNVILAETITSASENIQEGQSIARPLQESGQFPPMVVHMVKVGERTGELERMLNLVANAYDQEVDDAVKTATSVLAPLAILLVGGVVFTVALGLLLPMQQLTGSIRGI